MKKDFNQAAAVFDYPREVAQAWRDFPQIKDKVYFIDICAEEKLVYPEESAQKGALRQWISDHRYISLTIQEYAGKKGSCCLPDIGGKKILLLYTQKHDQDLLAKTATTAQETAFVFDHELGHAAIPDGSYLGGENKAECIADAYAIIRHFQRYGADSKAVDTLADGRAFMFAFKKDKAGHFTSPVVGQILARRREIDWSSLTPQQTAQLAWRFAMEYAVHPVLLNIMDWDLKKFQGRHDDIKNGGTAALRELAEKALSTDSSDIFKTGAAALKFCFDGKVAGLILAGDYWQEVRRKLAEKQKTIAEQDELLFGLGTGDRPLRRTPPSNKIMKR
jgi:hypothetical protein